MTIEIEIEIPKIGLQLDTYPVHLKNWTKEYKMRGAKWETAIETFSKTTNGRMCGKKGDTKFYLVFDNEADYITYLLRYS